MRYVLIALLAGAALTIHAGEVFAEGEAPPDLSCLATVGFRGSGPKPRNVRYTVRNGTLTVTGVAGSMKLAPRKHRRTSLFPKKKPTVCWDGRSRGLTYGLCVGTMYGERGVMITYPLEVHPVTGKAQKGAVQVALCRQ